MSRPPPYNALRNPPPSPYSPSSSQYRGTNARVSPPSTVRSQQSQSSLRPSPLTSRSRFPPDTRQGGPPPGPARQMRPNPPQTPRFHDGPLSVSEKFSISGDPSLWALSLRSDAPEPDDYLHNPDPRRDRKIDRRDTIFTCRGVANIGFLLLVALALLGLFAAYPITSYFISHQPSKLGAHGIGGVNASGQVPELSTRFALVDADTPTSAYYYKTQRDGSKWSIIFSDEFNLDNRSFYGGDDPYWEGVDLHYWNTGDLEWYDPSALTTQGGSLRITLSQEENHDLEYKSGHVTTWNKFCFTGGYVELNVSLPGSPKYSGLWPAAWMMGNLGRAGYGATTDGLWPYSYDNCDWGTLPNQTFNDQPSVVADNLLSYQQGQRLSRCTCKNDPNHPGPQRSDGTFYGRSAPEIDIFEAESDGTNGLVSQSAQYAPFNAAYQWANGTHDATLYDPTNSHFNSYKGGTYQESVSSISISNQDAYEVTGGYTTYGMEYQPGPDGYITWFSDGKPTWTMEASAIGADVLANISAREVATEPMYIIMNLGISHGFGDISPDLTFPTTMSIDYIRIYQDPNNRQVGCDPSSHPTMDYINQNIEIYNNPNLTTFSGGTAGSFNQTKPKNMLIDDCS